MGLKPTFTVYSVTTLNIVISSLRRTLKYADNIVGGSDSVLTVQYFLCTFFARLHLLKCIFG